MGYKFRSSLIITILYGLIFVLFLFVDFIYEGMEFEIYFIALLSLGGIFLQYLISPIILNFIFRIDWIDFDQLQNQEPHIAALIDNVCKKYNIKIPKFGIINDGTPNAFTYGWTKNSARLVITDGILDLLNPDEQRAVVAHELGHIQHNDFVIMTFVAAIPIMFYTIFRLLTYSNRSRRYSSGRSSSSGKSDSIKIIIALFSYIMYIIGTFLTLLISRLREYYADEFSARETQDPNSLASALVKIAYGILQKPMEGKKSSRQSEYVRALGIFDKKSAKQLVYSATNSNHEIDNNLLAKACAWDLYQPWAKYYELLSTHPLPAKRIKKLSYMSYKEFQIPPKVDLSSAEIEFKKEMGTSAWDEFLGELIIYILPKLMFWSWLIVGVVLMISDYNFNVLAPIISNFWSFMSFSFVLAGIFQLIQNRFKYSIKFNENEIVKLIGTIKVSPIRPVPTITKGHVIGRGVPGLFWSEDVVIQDQNGIMFIDYDFGIGFINTLFGIFKAEKLKGRDVEITGWYRRGPSPFIQVHRIKMLDGSGKSFGNYKRAFWNIISLILIGIGISLWYITIF